MKPITVGPAGQSAAAQYSEAPARVPVRAEQPCAAYAVSAQPKPVSLADFSGVYHCSPVHRVGLIRHGVRAVEIKDMARLMDTPQDKIYKILNLSTATINRKASRDEGLSSSDSERALGMSRMVGQVQAMVGQSGQPDGFDAAKWLARWLDEPVPALGGERPAAYMDTMEGQRMVSDLLAMMQSGAYA